MHNSYIALKKAVFIGLSYFVKIIIILHFEDYLTEPNSPEKYLFIKVLACELQGLILTCFSYY